MEQWHTPRRADIIYLQILHLAARTMEDDVAAALTTLVEEGKQWNKEDLDRLLVPNPTVVPQLETGVVDLSRYDSLLEGMTHELA